MQKTKKTTYTFLFLITLLGSLATGLNSCKKIVQVSRPPSEIPIAVAFQDSATATGAVTGIYSGMTGHSSFEWGGITNQTAKSADDIYSPILTDAFALDTILTTDGTLSGMWTQAFSSLLIINTCIEGLQGTTALSTALQHQLLGECFFSRAFVNFYLVNLWGSAMPLILTPDLKANEVAPSVPTSQVYQQIVKDLLQAQSLLTNSYPTTGRVRPNAMAATALLARTYLYMNDYTDAVTQAGTVINSGLYGPLPAPASAFLLGSKEAIWQLLPPGGATGQGATPDGNNYLNSIPANCLIPQLLAAFEPGDLRQQNWVGSLTYQGAVYYRPAKYKDKGKLNNTITEYYILLRLAEQYLVRAEANARLKKIPDAVSDLNIIRSRAGLPALSTSLSLDQCMAAVEQERRVELFAEWGHRWLDLKRWPGFSDPSSTRADEVLGVEKPTWRPYAKLYPLPSTELLYEPNLVQNPGYPDF